MRPIVLLPLFVVIPSWGVSVAAEIHDAATDGDRASVEVILDNDPAQLSARNERNETPIHVAAAGGHTDAVRLLLERGLPVDIGDNENSTALDVAAIFDHPDLARFLTDAGADPRHRDDNGMTPLHFACYNGNREIAAFLIEQGADVAAGTNSGSTPLHGAAFIGDVGCIELLTDHGAEVNTRNEAGFTPAISAAAGRGGLDALELLHSRGADIHDRTFNGDSALMHAARAGKVDVAEYLLSAGASLSARNDSGWSAILNAVESGDSTMVAHLLERGADPDTDEGRGRRALWWAALRGHRAVVELLIERGADVGADPPDDAPAVARAMDGGHLEVCGLLLENGAPVDAVDPSTRRTTLHSASLKGLTDFVSLLLKHGADPNLRDAGGRTAIHYAGLYGHGDVVELLRESGAETAGLVENYGRCELLDRPVAQGQAAMWYLGHCGWAIKTSDRFLIFDYWNGSQEPASPCLTNGHIDPAEIADQRVVVFVTHDHADHYDPVIHGWADRIEDVSYVFGFRPELAPQHRESGYDGVDYEHVGPREHSEIEGIEVRTIEANDAGVGFLLEVDGLSIYHAGDHAGWADGERDGFITEIDHLRPFAEDLDLAFVNVTGCHAHDPERLKEGNFYTIRELEPKVLVPTHALDREYLYVEAAEELSAAGAATDFCCPGNRGDSYFYNGTSIE
jgi:ankyrin repeat protein/L-ascorbate metabolism protein UlaG (beta-lactamase superfamily)